MMGDGSGSRALAVVAGAVVLTAAGCSASGGSSAPGALAGSATAPAPVSSSSASPASPTSSSSGGASVLDANGPEAQGALAAYRGMWADVVAAGTTDDYQNPKLGQHLTGDAASYWVGAMRVDLTKGAVAHGEPKLLSPVVSRVVPSATSPQAVVDDCVDVSSWRLFTTDGSRYDNDPGGRHKAEALVVSSGGVWKVSEFAWSAVGTC